MESIIVNCFISLLVLSVVYSARKDIKGTKSDNSFIKAIRLDYMRETAKDLTDEFAVYADELLSQKTNQ